MTLGLTEALLEVLRSKGRWDIQESEARAAEAKSHRDTCPGSVSLTFHCTKLSLFMTWVTTLGLRREFSLFKSHSGELRGCCLPPGSQWGTLEHERRAGYI